MAARNIFEEETEWMCSYYKAIDLERLFRYLRMCTSTLNEFLTPSVVEMVIATACLLEPHKVEACISTFFEETDSSRHSKPIFLSVTRAVFEVAGFNPSRLHYKRNAQNNKKNRNDSRLRIQRKLMQKNQSQTVDETKLMGELELDFIGQSTTMYD